MKTNVNSKVKAIYAISVLLLALGLPSLVSASHFPERGDLVAGAKAWADNCSRCHNARDPADLRDDQWTSTMFHMRMRAGLTGQQTRDILTFLQDSNVPISVEPLVFESGSAEQMSESVSTLSGSDIYSQTCIACHAANGKGAVPGAPNFTSADGVLSQADDVLFQHIKKGFKSPGSAMAMPPKGGNSSLTDADMKVVLQYLKDTYHQ